MAKTLGDRLSHAWNVFRNPNVNEPPPSTNAGFEVSFGARPDRVRLPGYSYKRIIAPVLTHISIDAANVELREVIVDDEGRYTKDFTSYLNECFMVSPNLDQSPAQFRQDAILTMMETGTVAVVPVQTTENPTVTEAFDIQQLQVGPITAWYPQHVRVSLYDERSGTRKEVVVPKKTTAIVENPLYQIMNEPNSTLQRLLTKLNQLDVTDERVSSGKLDIILQLPYTIKHEARRKEADKRRGDLEDQLTNSRYGVGYIDGTEHITQLNRPAENQLLEQVKVLEDRLYSQMGLTEEVFLGTADEAAMINYHNRTIFPIVQAFQEEYNRKFLSKTARSRKHAILYFRDPFKLVPVSQIAEIADKFTRNEIMSPNEIRPIVGMKPVDDPKADELRNRNMPQVDVDQGQPETDNPPDNT